LMERAGVEEDAARDELLEPRGRDLRGELYLRRAEAGAQRTLDLRIARRVDPEPERAEEAEDRPRRVRLHRVAECEAEGVREGERAARGRLERRTVVDEARRPEPFAHLGGLGAGEEHGAQRITAARRNATARRHTAVQRFAIDPAPDGLYS